MDCYSGNLEDISRRLTQKDNLGVVIKEAKRYISEFLGPQFFANANYKEFTFVDSLNVCRRYDDDKSYSKKINEILNAMEHPYSRLNYNTHMAVYTYYDYECVQRSVSLCYLLASLMSYGLDIIPTPLQQLGPDQIQVNMDPRKPLFVIVHRTDGKKHDRLFITSNVCDILVLHVNVESAVVRGPMKEIDDIVTVMLTLMMQRCRPDATVTLMSSDMYKWLNVDMDEELNRFLLSVGFLYKKIYSVNRGEIIAPVGYRDQIINILRYEI